MTRAMTLSIENRARIAFALVLLVGAAAALAWWLVDAGRYATFQIVTADPVSGLIPDSPVEFHGVEVGKVKRVELTGPRSISILLEVDRRAPVTTATVATITARGLATRGFTGYVYIALEEVGGDRRPLAAPEGSPYPVIPTAPSRSVSLDTAIAQVNQNVQFLTDLLHSVLDQNTVASLKESVDSLQRIAQTLDANNEKLGTIIVNAERASTQLGPLLQSSGDALRALQNQVLPEAYRTLANLDSLSSSLSEVTESIKRDPSVVIRGERTPPGPGESR
jgi:phospholipid/cholesterol/gamma-HCH transport system substrate-binding protein